MDAAMPVDGNRLGSLSGGGYRTLLSMGFLWRLNDSRLKRRADRRIRRSGVSTLTGLLVSSWRQLRFANDRTPHGNNIHRLEGPRTYLRWTGIVLPCLLSILWTAVASAAGISAWDYQVPMAPTPASVSAAIETLPVRQKTVIAVMACGSEFDFIANLRKKSNGEGITASILGKLAWLQVGLQRQHAAMVSAPVPACETTVAVTHRDVCRLFAMDCVSDDDATRRAAEDAFKTHAAWTDLLQWTEGAYSGDTRRSREALLAWLPSQCQDQQGKQNVSLAASSPSTSPSDQVRLTFRIAPECLTAQINVSLLGISRGALQVGTEGARCHLFGETKGDWDASLKNLIRIAELDRREPILSEESRTYLNHVLIDIDGGPAQEGYTFWECGNEERSVGSPQERSDERSSVESILDDIGDSGWDLLALALLLLIIVAALAVATLAVAAKAAAAVLIAAAAVIVAGTGLLFVEIPETENHLWMINSTKYLNNQYIMNSGGSGYATDQADLRDWILQDMQRILRNDFIEYNSRPYQRYTLVAIANLADFASDDDVRTGARLVLEYAAAKYSISSNEGRRIVPFRRKREAMPFVDGMPRGEVTDPKNGLFDLSRGADHLHAFGLYYFGFSLNLPEFDGHPYAATRGYASHAIYYATSDYRPDEATYSLAMDRQGAPLVHQRLHHAGYEIVSSGSTFTITAGGLATGMAKNATIDLIDRIIQPDDLGAAVPTVLMLAGPPHLRPTLQAKEVKRPTENRHSSLQRFIRFEGQRPADDDVTPSYNRNLCVWDGFACGVNVRLPTDLPRRPPCMVPGPRVGWFFVRSDAPGCTAYNSFPPFWMVIYLRTQEDDISGFGGISNYGFLEIVDGSEMPFSVFMGRVLARNPGPVAPMVAGDNCGGVYVSARGSTGQRIEFSCERVTKVDSQEQPDPDDWNHAGAPPGALGYAPMQSSGDGRVDITSRSAKRKVTLNFEQWDEPQFDTATLP